MALSTTANYGLRKHDAGDLNWDVDLNWTMTEIDKKLKLLFANFLTCSTAVGAAAKVAAFTNFVLETGCLIAVKFTNGNSASGATLDVNSTGTKAIYYNDSAIPTSAIAVGGVYLFIYDGTNWVILNPMITAGEAGDALNAPYEAVQELGTLAANTTIDCSSGNIVTCTIGAALTFTLNTDCFTGYCRTLTMLITNGGAYAITWQASVKWSGGTAPTLTVSGVDIVTFMTVDNGTTWYGSLNGVAFA